MSDEKRLCSKGCGRELGGKNKTGICTPCQKPNRFKKTDDSVLSRMGFGGSTADEAPPRRRSRGRRAPRVAPPAAPPWRDQFAALTRALGLDPDAMLETYCREWVESTRSRALTPVPPFIITETTRSLPEGA